MRTRTPPAARASSAASARAAARGVEPRDRADRTAGKDIGVGAGPGCPLRVLLPVGVVDGSVEAVGRKIDRRKIGAFGAHLGLIALRTAGEGEDRRRRDQPAAPVEPVRHRLNCIGDRAAPRCCAPDRIEERRSDPEALCGLVHEQ